VSTFENGKGLFCVSMRHGEQVIHVRIPAKFQEVVRRSGVWGIELLTMQWGVFDDDIDLNQTDQI